MAVLEKRGVVSVFEGVEMVRLHGYISPSRAVLCLQKGGDWPIFCGHFSPIYVQNKYTRND